MKNHESYCVLSELHAGPCSEHEAECYVQNDEGAVLWREAGDDTATKERCVKAAIKRKVERIRRRHGI